MRILERLSRRMAVSPAGARPTVRIPGASPRIAANDRFALFDVEDLLQPEYRFGLAAA